MVQDLWYHNPAPNSKPSLMQCNSGLNMMKSLCSRTSSPLCSSETQWIEASSKQSRYSSRPICLKHRFSGSQSQISTYKFMWGNSSTLINVITQDIRHKYSIEVVGACKSFEKALHTTSGPGRTRCWCVGLSALPSAILGR